MLDSFASRHLSLLYGLSALFSFYFAINHDFFTPLLLFAISLSCASNRKKFFSRFILLWGVNAAVIIYGSTIYKLPSTPPEGIKGTLEFQICTLTPKETHFGRQLIYSGKGKRFIPEKTLNKFEAKNFPCSIFINLSKNTSLPSGEKDYLINGILKKGVSGNYILSIDKQTPWIPIKNSSSFAETRYRLKEKVKKFIHKRIPDFQAAEFLSGIVTGQFEDKVMCAEFGKLGLLHLMAISGFHFALVAGIFASLFRLFFPQRAAIVLLIFLLSSYFFFLGSSPSIVRAWTMSVIAFTAFLLERKPVALNALGASFLFILIFDPLLVNTMGFQFSAAVTASILLFYPITNSILENFIAKRSLSKVSQMPSFDQHCYFILSVFREGLALTLAVNIIAIPLSLYYFSKFPLMSLVYNFFVPLLVSCSLFFLILSSLFYFLFPYLGTICFSLTAHFTHFMLNFIYNAPSSMNVYWYIPNIPSLGISLYLTLAFCAGIFAKKANQNHSQDARLL